MKKFRLTLSALFLTFTLFAQGIGYVKNKSTDLYHNGGSNVFFCSFRSNAFAVSCVDVDSAKLTETTIELPSAKTVSSYCLIGVNNFYAISQVQKKGESTVFPSVVISSWDGKTEPTHYEFPGRWNGELRYAIANDRDMYFMLDMLPVAFSEESVYRAKRTLLHLNLVSGTLNEIPCPLSMNYSEPQCSFWCPLRIGDNFTEWYRTKMVNKRFTYEITRLDLNGREVWTRTVASQLSTGSPDFVPETPRYTNNIITVSNVWSATDTVRKVTSFSLLTIAPLNYVPELDRYFSVAHISQFKEKYSRGVYLLVLDGDLSVVRSDELPFLVQGNQRFRQPATFASVSIYAAFPNDSTAYIDAVYRKANNKVIEHRCYRVDERTQDSPSLKYSFAGMTGNYYPGNEAEEKLRAQVAVDLSDALFVCTKKGTLYYVPDQKDTNVFFVKAKS